MITVKNFQPVNLDGPYRRRLRAVEIAVSAIGHVALGTLLAYVALGAAGWL